MAVYSIRRVVGAFYRTMLQFSSGEELPVLAGSLLCMIFMCITGHKCFYSEQLSLF